MFFIPFFRGCSIIKVEHCIAHTSVPSTAAHMSTLLSTCSTPTTSRYSSLGDGALLDLPSPSSAPLFKPLAPATGDDDRAPRGSTEEAAVSSARSANATAAAGSLCSRGPLDFGSTAIDRATELNPGGFASPVVARVQHRVQCSAVSE
jgi:hypothetical protein